MRQRRWRSALVVAGLAAVVAAAGQPSAGAAPAAPVAVRPAVAVADTETALVRFRLPGTAFLDRLVAEGADLAGRPHAAPTGGGAVLADVVVTGRELAALAARGAVPVQVVERAADGPARYRASIAAAQRRTRAGLATKSTAAAATDTLTFLQAYHWTTGGQTFVQTEVATTAVADPDVEITVSWRTADGTTGSFPLSRFEDAGEYQYHVALPQPVPSVPVTLTATSSLGGTGPG